MDDLTHDVRRDGRRSPRLRSLYLLPRGVALLAGLDAGLGLGGIALLTPLPTWSGGWLMVLGTAGPVAVYVPLWRRAPAAAVLVQAGGAVLATGATVLWVGGVPVHALLHWLAVTLIAGAAALATVTSLLWPAVGYRLLGATYLSLTVWLVRHDVARRTIRSTGLPRFMAACMLAGYAWLALGIRGVDDHGAPVILPAVLRRPLPAGGLP